MKILLVTRIFFLMRKALLSSDPKDEILFKCHDLRHFNIINDSTSLEKDFFSIFYLKSRLNCNLK